MTKPLPPSRRVVDDAHIQSGPFWGELRVFLAVAKARSFSRAAEALNMSQPTVSRQVRRLQDVMGAQLVIPTQAGIKLTRQGEELAKSLVVLDHTLFEISNEVTADARNAEGLVKVAVGEALAGLFMVPSLLTFSERYPNIRLEICTPVSLTDFRANQADVMIGLAPSQLAEVVSQPLGVVHMLPIATQPYIDRYGVPTHSNLSSHCFLQSQHYATGDGLWDSWLKLIARGVATHSCDNSLTYSLLVKSGLGIGLVGSCALCDPAVIPLELGVHIRAPLYALASNDRLAAKTVRLVFEWLVEAFGPSVPWFRPELSLERLPRDSLAQTLASLLAGSTQTL